MFAFQTLVGLLLTNGPGAISAQGAKGAVSAEGPERPYRVQLNKALIGFLSHTGYAHGGNGYERIGGLSEQFRGAGLKDPSAKDRGIDLRALAAKAVERYARCNVRSATRWSFVAGGALVRLSCPARCSSAYPQPR